ncbi:MAG: tetratricopeptide repeat protein [Sinimarinibacterium flocculans]|uniref:tetratricopeptide repeat protein n=1 Tax=Sinimarinibacterium flocculans TaxID=985250 RepID=UPI002492EB12|nr:tetratricopeptide repeat protein [Sinimarinibacterium flocculans]
MAETLFGAAPGAGSASAEIIDVTDFAREVIERSQQIPVLVDFWADWCGPCKQLTPMIEAAVRRFAGRVVLAKVDTERHQQWAQRAGVRSIPNVKLIIGGRVVDEFTGVQPQSTIEQWLEQMLPPPPVDVVAEADALLAQGHVEDAHALLMQALQDPQSPPGVPLRLARLLLLEDPQSALGLIAQIPPGTREHDDAQAMQRVLAFMQLSADDLEASPAKAPYVEAARRLSEGQIEAAMDSLIDAVRADRKFNEDAARKRLIDLFDWLGSGDERTREYRLRLYDVL